MKVDVIIPLREKDIFNSDKSEKFIHEGIPLHSYTLEEIENSKFIRNIYFAIDSVTIKDLINTKNSNFNFIYRPKKLSKNNITTIDVLRYIFKDLDYLKKITNYFVYLEISHPYRPTGFINQILEIAKKENFDSIITTRKVNYNIWTKNNKNNFDRIVSLGNKNNFFNYEELLGICSVFKSRNFLNENVFGKLVNVISINNLWSCIDVRDKKSFEFFLNNYSYLKKKIG